MSAVSPDILDRSCKIAVAGTGYICLSLAVLLSQHSQITAVDIVPEKVDKLNGFMSPIQDEYIEKYLYEAKKGKRALNLTATADGAAAFVGADFIIVAAPTNYDPRKNFFECWGMESVLALTKESTKDKQTKPFVIIKSIISVGYTVHIREKMYMDKILTSSSPRNSCVNQRPSMTTSIPARSSQAATDGPKKLLYLCVSPPAGSLQESQKPSLWDTPGQRPPSCS